MNNSKTPADLLWGALKATILSKSCGSGCGCVERAMRSAKDLRNDGQLKEYLSGQMSLNDAMFRVVVNTMPDTFAMVISAFSIETIIDTPSSFRRGQGRGDTGKGGKAADGK